MKPTQEQVIAWAREVGMERCDCEPRCHLHTGGMGSLTALVDLAYEAGQAAVRKHILDTVEELYNSEFDRHPMFSEGYNYALDHFEQFSKGAKS